MWASANVIAQGFDRLRKSDTVNNLSNSGNQLNGLAMNQAPTGPIDRGSATEVIHIEEADDFDWMRFFPFVSKSTNGIAESLVTGREQGTATRGFPSPNNELFHDTLLAQYQDLFDPFTDYTLGFPDFTFHQC